MFMGWNQVWVDYPAPTHPSKSTEGSMPQKEIGATQATDNERQAKSPGIALAKPPAQHRDL
jgi:hypothetical protein